MVRFGPAPHDTDPGEQRRKAAEEHFDQVITELKGPKGSQLPRQAHVPELLNEPDEHQDTHMLTMTNLNSSQTKHMRRNTCQACMNGTRVRGENMHGTAKGVGGIG